MIMMCPEFGPGGFFCFGTLDRGFESERVFKIDCICLMNKTEQNRNPGDILSHVSFYIIFVIRLYIASSS